ncbi:hypothetical protein JYU23_01730 [bacterium AH-315-C07]|nr:hypothetical protein [bacterium AH-315-C07]
MSSAFNKFLVILTTVSVLFLSISWFILNNTYEAGHLFLSISVIIIIFYLSSLGSSAFLFRANKKRPQALIRASMGVTTLKFFLNAVLLIVFILLNKEDAKMIIAFFFAAYVLYVVLEKVFVINQLQKENQKAD